MAYSRSTHGQLPFEDQIAAKLDVLIEGIADHKMDPEGRRRLGSEIVCDIVCLVRESP